MRMRRLLLVFLIVFTTVTALFAQSNSNISVVYLKPLTNDTEASRAHRLDNRGKNCALIRIITENLNAEERSKIKIKADQGTEVFLEKGDGELKLFLTEGVRNLRITHDDYGRLDYNVPIDIEGFKTYEMDIKVDKSGFQGPGGDAPRLSSNYVQVEVTPADASIIIDDEPRPDGSAYLTLDDDHTLVVSKALYHTHTQTIRASKNKKEVYKVNLKPAFGWLEIISQPEDGAVVFIDGIEKGKTPYKSERLESGEHQVRLFKEMYESLEKTVRVRDNETSTVTLKMKANYADVTLNVADRQAELYVDGKKVSTGPWKGRLSSGAHLVEAKREFHTQTTKEVICQVGVPMTVTIDNPIPIIGTLNIKSNPTKARIIIDGKDTGRTTPDIISDVYAGEHTVRIEKEGCTTYERKIVIRKDEIVTVDATLAQGKNITITSDSRGDKIFVNGQHVGETPLTIGLKFGKNDIVIEHNGLRESRQFEVTENGANSIHIVIGAKVTINTVNYDEWGSRRGRNDGIWVDGSYLSQNPVRLGLGSHRVKAKNGGKTKTKTFTVRNNNDMTVKLNMTRNQRSLGAELLWGFTKHQDSDTISNVLVGAFYEHGILQKQLGNSDWTFGVTLKSGVYYKSYTIKRAYGTYIMGYNQEKVTYSNLAIPLLLKLYLGVGSHDFFYIDAGPMFALNGNVTVKNNTISTSTLTPLDGKFLRMDVGINLVVNFGVTYIMPLDNQTEELVGDVEAFTGILFGIKLNLHDVFK